jgi:hypothetical protein
MFRGNTFDKNEYTHPLRGSPGRFSGASPGRTVNRDYAEKNEFTSSKEDKKTDRCLIKSHETGGGQGLLPLGCLPLWGREGVTLPMTTADTSAMKKVLS